jgi:hypothetical protein
MQHMRFLCKTIGPRPATSDAERRAAEYAKQILAELGLKDVQEQPFRSYPTMGWGLVPLILVLIAVIGLGLVNGMWPKLIGGVLLLLCGITYTQFLRARPAWYEPLVARAHSQNVIATIPSREPPQRKLFLVGHFDSNKQRMLMPAPWPQIEKAATSFGQVACVGLGVIYLGCAWLSPETPVWLWGIGVWLILVFVLSLVLSLMDESHNFIEGANDNATAVSILLGVAAGLKANPLQNTEVALLFTGCEEAGCIGMENYLRQYQPTRENTYWIDLEMVGTGDLAYITRHGISYLAGYAPTPAMVEMAAQTAKRYPELGVRGKDMLILEEVSNLRHWGHNAICIAGYNAGGWLPNWHRYTDNLEHIEPATLTRAAHYTWRLMEQIDSN